MADDIDRSQERFWVWALHAPDIVERLRKEGWELRRVK